MLPETLVTEWIKMKRSIVWLPVVSTPLLALLLALPDAREADNWQAAIPQLVTVYAIMLLPLLAGTLASMLCRVEHLNGGWKQLSALPVPRSAVYAAKLLSLFALLALVQATMLLGVALAGLLLRLNGPVPWADLAATMCAGWLAALPLAALQLWASLRWRSFGVPFAINVMLTVPVVAIAGSKYALYYPWAQPLHAMLHVQGGAFAPSVLITIAAGLAAFVGGGWFYYAKRDILG